MVYGLDELVADFRREGLQVADHQRLLLGRYVSLLLDWNSKINLISRRDVENVWAAHILHSLAILLTLEIPAGARVVDVGSGGGLPGIPLAIARPDLQLLLVDSIRKKVTALEEILRQCGLANVRCQLGRAEELAMQPGFHGGFDIAVARGVASLADLCRWCRGFLDGRPASPDTTSVAGSSRQRLLLPALVAFKGGDLTGEVNEAKIKAGVAPFVVAMRIPGAAVLGLEEKKLAVVHFGARAR